MDSINPINLINKVNHSEKTLQILANWVVAITVFVIPFFFLPITPDFFVFNKQAFILVATSILLVLWLIRTITTKRISLQKSPFTLVFLLFAASSIASLFFASTNKIEALINPFGAATLVTLTLFSLLVGTLVNDNGKKLVKNALLLSSALLAVVTLYQYLGLGELIAPIEFMKSRQFTPTGSLLTTAMYLAIFIPFVGARLYSASEKKHRIEVILATLTGLIILVGVGVVSYQLVTTAKPVLLPQRSGWTIAVEALKNSPIFGVGSENFLTAFTQGKSISLNQDDMWNIRFTTASNAYFHFFTVFGILGLATFAFIALRSLAVFKLNKEKGDEAIVSLIGIFVIGAFLPPNFLLLFLIFTFAALVNIKKNTLSVKLPANQFMGVAYLMPIAAIVAVLYFATRAYAAEVTFKRSFDALSQNKGGDAYKRQIQAISQNPYRTRYHIAYSQTNLALATSMAQNQDISDQDRTNISQLIQQAIREGRNSVILNRINPVNWENLARIYRKLIGIAEGAENWAVASYQQAIALDPTNPLLRIEMGGIFFAANELDGAIRQFEMAIQLKPDLANAHYNLAVALREKKQYQKALNEMATVLQLVEPNSNDASVAQQEYDKLKELAGIVEKEAGEPETLTTPQAEPQQQLNPPLELPEEEVAPPQVEEIVEETAEPTP